MLGVLSELGGGLPAIPKLCNPSWAMLIYIANHNLLSFEFKSQALQVHNYDCLLDSER